MAGEKAIVRVGIIGGGASGCIAAIHLLRQFGDSISLTIFDPAEELGAGLAYGTREESHLLNVPAANMGIFPEQAEGFHAWLTARNIRSEFCPFFPRNLFRQYLQSEWTTWNNKYPHSVQWERKWVDSLQRKNQRWNLYCDGETFVFDYCFVATGFKSQIDAAHLNAKIPLQGPVLSAYESLAPILEVPSILIVGSGLSALDCWRELRAKGFSGKVHFLSRRGLLPVSHPESAVSSDERIAQQFLGKSPLDSLRLAIALNTKEGKSWPQIASDVRTIASKLWQSWSTQHRKQFSRHLRPYWEVIRHRAPGKIIDDLRLELEQGQCFLHKARILEASQETSRIRVVANTPNGILQLNVSAILLASGAKIENSLAPFSEGDNLWKIGPAAKEVFWEITAVPEIRAQVARITKQLSAKLGSPEGIAEKYPEQAPPLSAVHKDHLLP